jgi:LAO/AO transport system kinase
MTPDAALSAEKLAEAVMQGEVGALARAITLVESTHPQKRSLGSALLQKLKPPEKQTFRIGLSGIPGAGKSTLIEALGLEFIRRGLKVAVLSIDPSSAISGGSILGDKTRMPRLASHPMAYIRPSPSRSLYGGLAPHTFEAVFLCEAAGFQVVFIETVGTGQSESDVAHIADVLVLVNVPGQGDDLQGIKRGIMELCDIIVINKADDPDDDKVRRALAHLKQALAYMPGRPHGLPVEVIPVSALHVRGVDRLADTLESYFSHIENTGFLQQARQARLRNVFIQYLRNALWNHVQSRASVQEVFNRSLRELGDNPYRLYPLAEAVLQELKKA